MYRFRSVGFLLLLLVCDWAGDPYFGESFLSVPYSNQVMVCPSAAKPDNLRREANGWEHLHCLTLASEQMPGMHRCGPLLPDTNRPPLLIAQSVYVLMSIRR